MSTNVVSDTAEAGIDRGGSFVAASDDTRAPFRIQVPTPVPSSPSQPVSAGSLTPESFGKLPTPRIREAVKGHFSVSTIFGGLTQT